MFRDVVAAGDWGRVPRRVRIGFLVWPELAYGGGVSEDVDRMVRELRERLEGELDRRLAPRGGCWPAAVAVAGVALGVWLLLTRGCAP